MCRPVRLRLRQSLVTLNGRRPSITNLCPRSVTWRTGWTHLWGYLPAPVCPLMFWRLCLTAPRSLPLAPQNLEAAVKQHYHLLAVVLALVKKQTFTNFCLSWLTVTLLDLPTTVQPLNRVLFFFHVCPCISKQVANATNAKLECTSHYGRGRARRCHTLFSTHRPTQCEFS